MSLKDRLVDPNSPDRRPRKAAYALPTLFTAGNIFLGYISILRSFQGAMQAAVGAAAASDHFIVASQAIAAAVVLDGLDGGIARMTNTTSAFGREMDSLADVISFGLAPAVLAFAWGVQFIDPIIGEKLRGQIFNAGSFVAFLFLLCGACRLARFNVQVNPIPKNPGRPDRKYFVGLPIPAAARPGDQDCLTHRPLPSSAAIPCWPAKSATSYLPPAPILRSASWPPSTKSPARSPASATSPASSTC